MGLRRVEQGRSFGHVNRVMVFEAFCIIVERDPASSATNCCSSARVDCSGSRQIVSGKKNARESTPVPRLASLTPVLIVLSSKNITRFVWIMRDEKTITFDLCP